MEKVIIMLRAGHLFAHAAHNLVTGPSFFGDHAFFGSSYEAFDSAYDSCVEQEIARGNTIDIGKIGIKAATQASGMLSDVDADSLFESQNTIEESLRMAIEDTCGSMDDAGQSLLQKIAEDSLSRTYKINGRLGK